jgi:hypothetical protein
MSVHLSCGGMCVTSGQVYRCNICDRVSQHVAVCPLRAAHAAQTSSAATATTTPAAGAGGSKHKGKASASSSFNFMGVLGSSGGKSSSGATATWGRGAALTAGRDFVPLGGRTASSGLSSGVKRPADGGGGGGAVNLLELEREMKRQSKKKRKSGEGAGATGGGGGLGSLHNLLNQPSNSRS